MIKKLRINLAVQIGIISLLLGCNKNYDPEPVSQSIPIQNNPSLLMATAAPVSNLTGPGLMLGINGHPLSDAPYVAVGATKQIQLLKGMGMSWYRINVQTKPDGTISASELFNILQQTAVNSNIKLLPMLYTRTLDLSKTEAESYKLGKTLGSNFAEKYGKYFTYYDLGNDLELELLLPTKTGQSQFHYNRKKFNVTAAYLKGMDEGIKSKDQDAKTMISAGWLHYGFIRMCDWYGVKFDVVAYHWYSDMEGAAPNNPYNIDDITVKLASLFPNKPIWFTEVNYRYKPTNNNYEDDQNAYMKKFITKCKNNPQVKAVLIYELFNEPYKNTEERNFGIVKWTVPYTIWAKKLIAKTLTL
jgi:hypothetical protein